MKTLLLRVCAVALALLAVPLLVAPAAAQFDVNAYTLLKNGTSAGALTAPPGTYNLQLPATFNGATITVTFTTANGTISTYTYTSQPAVTPCFHTSAGTTVSITTTGGTPSGNTVFAGNTRCGSGDVSPPAMLPAQAAAATWVTGSTAQDARNYGSVTIQVSGLSGGDSIAVTGSLLGSSYAPLTGIGADFSTAATITADGIYSFPGGQYLKWAQTGSASTPTVTIRAGS